MGREAESRIAQLRSSAPAALLQTFCRLRLTPASRQQIAATPPPKFLPGISGPEAPSGQMNLENALTGSMVAHQPPLRRSQQASFLAQGSAALPQFRAPKAHCLEAPTAGLQSS